MCADESRRSQFVRQWRLLLALRQGPRTLRELATECGVHERTIRRDLYALQRVPLPITSRFPAGEGQSTRRGVRAGDPNLWCLGETPAWPRREAFPIAELRV